MNQERYLCEKFGVCPNGEQRFGFLLLPTFAMLPFVSAIEPLRAANRYSGKALYSWRVFTADGQPTHACNGMQYTPDSAFEDVQDIDILFICGPQDPLEFDNTAVYKELRRLNRQGIKLGGMDTGTYILASAGLIGDHHCTLHWESLPGFTQEFPSISVSMELFEFDRDRLTCAGGTAALDMMLHLVSLQNGERLANKSSELFIHNGIRDAHQPQRMDIRVRTGIHDSRLLDCIAIMEANHEHPLLTHEIASAVGLSIRQIERLFQQHLNVTPIRYYLDLRITHARQLLEQTSCTLMDISLQTGFSSPSHFSQHFRKRFGVTPKQYRLQQSAQKAVMS